MEISIKKYSEIGLILFELLHDYDCTMICIQTLKNEEKNDAIKYNIERDKNKHTKFSTHSFLYTLQGSSYFSGVKKRRNRIINRLPNQSSLYHTEADKYEILINKYDEILNTPNISQKQRDIILKMKNNRISKHLKNI